MAVTSITDQTTHIAIIDGSNTFFVSKQRIVSVNPVGTIANLKYQEDGKELIVKADFRNVVDPASVSADDLADNLRSFIFPANGGGGGGGGDATAANQVIQITEAQTTNTLLSSLDGKDFATETTLDALLTAVQNQDTTLTSDSATLRVIAELLFEMKFLLKSIAE